MFSVSDQQFPFPQFTGERKQTNFGYFGFGPFAYTSLSATDALSRLLALANGKSTDSGCHWISFQPALREQTQDRQVIEDWKMDDGVWKFRAVFDGHAGHECVDYAAANVPGLIMAALKKLTSTNAVTVDSVSTLLQSTLKSFDDSLISDLNSIHSSFPYSGDGHLSDLTDQQIAAIINDGDPETGLPNEEKGLKGENIQKVLRCMRGSTALVVLIDPKEENVWCCSLGDCVAVICTKKDAAAPVTTEILSSNHNASYPAEQKRVKSEHPEDEKEACMLNNRVLGAIAVSRALGDMAFKLPASYTHRILLNAKPGFQVHSKVEEFTKRNKTPPYMSSLGDVIHTTLKPLASGEERYLIMASDGLTDLWDEREPPSDYSGLQNPEVANWEDYLQRCGTRWTDILSPSFCSASNIVTSPKADSEALTQAAQAELARGPAEEIDKNLALKLLLHSLSRGAGTDAPPIDLPTDEEKRKEAERIDMNMLSRCVTVEKLDKIMDDVSILVQRV